MKHVPSSFYLRFYASVLHLRGNHVADQPFVEDEDVLIYVSLLASCLAHEVD